MKKSSRTLSQLAYTLRTLKEDAKSLLNFSAFSISIYPEPAEVLKNKKKNQF